MIEIVLFENTFRRNFITHRNVLHRNLISRECFMPEFIGSQKFSNAKIFGRNRKGNKHRKRQVGIYNTIKTFLFCRKKSSPMPETWVQLFIIFFFFGNVYAGIVFYRQTYKVGVYAVRKFSNRKLFGTQNSNSTRYVPDRIFSDVLRCELVNLGIKTCSNRKNIFRKTCTKRCIRSKKIISKKIQPSPLLTNTNTCELFPNKTTLLSLFYSITCCNTMAENKTRACTVEFERQRKSIFCLNRLGPGKIHFKPNTICVSINIYHVEKTNSYIQKIHNTVLSCVFMEFIHNRKTRLICFGWIIKKQKSHW